MTDNPKETAYDNVIAPMMTAIIAACKEHDIGLAATFQLDFINTDEGYMNCSTVVPATKNSPYMQDVCSCINSGVY